MYLVSRSVRASSSVSQILLLEWMSLHCWRKWSIHEAGNISISFWDSYENTRTGSVIDEGQEKFRSGVGCPVRFDKQVNFLEKKRGIVELFYLPAEYISYLNWDLSIVIYVYMYIWLKRYKTNFFRYSYFIWKKPFLWLGLWYVFLYTFCLRRLYPRYFIYIYIYIYISYIDTSLRIWTKLEIIRNNFTYMYIIMIFFKSDINCCLSFCQ